MAIEECSPRREPLLSPVVAPAAVTSERGLELPTTVGTTGTGVGATVDSQLVREQIISATKPSLARGEAVRCSSPVWVTECGGQLPLVFRRRALHYVAVTNRRLILFRAPRADRRLGPEDMLIAKRLSTFTLVKKRRFSRRLQLRIRGAGEREFVFEFHSGDLSIGEELATVLALAPALEAFPDY